MHINIKGREIFIIYLKNKIYIKITVKSTSLASLAHTVRATAL